MPRQLKLTIRDVSKQELLNFRNFETIKQARRELNIKKASDIYKFILNEFRANNDVANLVLENKRLRIENEKLHKIIAENKKYAERKQQNQTKAKYETQNENYLNIFKTILEPDKPLTKEEKYNVKFELIKEKRQYDKRALGDLFREIIIEPSTIDQKMNIQIMFEKVENELLKVFQENKNNNKINLSTLFKNKPEELNFTFNVITNFNMKKTVVDVDRKTEIIILNQHFHLPVFDNVRNTAYIKSYIEDYIEKLIVRMEEQKNASNIVFDGIVDVIIQISYTKKIKGGSYIETPQFIANKKCCTNIINDDDKCFLWSLIASRHIEDVKDKNLKNKQKAYNKKEWINEWKFREKMTFPFSIDYLALFEKDNNVKINVLGFNENSKVPMIIHNTKFKSDEVINLLLIQSDNKCHYLLVNDVNRLLSNKKETGCNLFHCINCFNPYSTKKGLDDHLTICGQYDAVKCTYPEKGEKLTFKNYNKTFKHPFSIYADFEATLLNCISPETDLNKSHKYQKHYANSFGVKLNCIHKQFSKDVEIVNNSNEEELLKQFIEKIEDYAYYAFKLTQGRNKNVDNIIMNEQQMLNHKCLKVCPDCKTKFDNDKHYKVKHHDHISGEYLATICNSCNLKYQLKTFIPVFFHNLKNYDSHFIIPLLSKYGQQDCEISAIPNNEQKYISFSKKLKFKHNDKEITFELRFIDTFAFMASSIETLGENIKKECFNKDKTIDFEKLKKCFPNLSAHYTENEQLDMMTQKGIYPYEFMNNYNKMFVDKLPPIDRFYSSLHKERCKPEDYERAKKVWQMFDCKQFIDYHNLYLTVDVLLLADIWENFRQVCYKIYELDPNYYHTAPSLSWDAMMKHCTENDKTFALELIHDPDMYLMFEQGIRGGLSQISKRYAKANHPELKDYNKDEALSYILYLDANNLYGYGMSAYLPYSDFKWNVEQWTVEKIMKLKDDDKDNKPIKGYLFEVDLEYPKELHDLHNGYALCSENKAIKNEWLNKFQILEKNKKGEDIEKNESKTEKLITNFFDKEKYVLNYRYLKLVLSLGLKLKQVHRVIEFTQKPFMKSYIMKNTNERSKSKNDFEKDFYKLMNNSVYGKTMENVRNRINFRLISSEEQALNILNQKKKFTIFNENCVGVHLLKREVKLNKAIWVGQTVLDQSKILMYEFHYKFMLPKIGKENLDLLFTDTDSLCYHIKNRNPYCVIASNKKFFDLSDYPEEHPLYDETNKKVIGKFKNDIIDAKKIKKYNDDVDEYNKNKKENEKAKTTIKEIHITEFVGLRSKVYAYKTNTNKTGKRDKGIKKSVVDKELSFDDYRNALFDFENLKKIQQNNFRCYEHRIYSEATPKIALSGKDDKCYILDDKINTLTLGHYKVWNKTTNNMQMNSYETQKNHIQEEKHL